MSADSWAVCPVCKQGDDYMATGTFKEEHEIGVFRGEFFVDYEGQCQECGFSISFHHRQNPLTLSQGGDT